MSEPQSPSRDSVIAMLASFGQRSPEEVAEQIGSLELTWLITQVEVHYGITLDLSDEELMQMSTLTGAVGVLRDVLDDADRNGAGLDGAGLDGAGLDGAGHA